MTARSLLRLAFGLLTGFLGAFITIQAIDRFSDDPAIEPLEFVLGAPDFDAFCGRSEDGALRAVSTTGDASGWECVGLLRQLWTTEEVDVGEVCRWQYGVAASVRLIDASEPDGWMCVTQP